MYLQSQDTGAVTRRSKHQNEINNDDKTDIQ